MSDHLQGEREVTDDVTPTPSPKTFFRFDLSKSDEELMADAWDELVPTGLLGPPEEAGENPYRSSPPPGRAA